MAITYHPEVNQGSEAWLTMRMGLLTASELRLIVTPTLKVASNDKERAHVWEIAAQRISQYVEPRYIGDDMLRGQEDEYYARQIYHDKFAPVAETGFVTNDAWGFTLGYSPDGLVGDGGLIEIKSRRQKFQIETIATGEVPADHMVQLQAGLLVTGREWIDFVSYSGGLPMIVIRVAPIAEYHEAIIAAASAFEARVAERVQEYHSSLVTARTVPTERRIDQEMFV